MYDDDSNFENFFRDRSSNNPAAWISIAKYFESFAKVIKGEVLPKLKVTDQAAEGACSILFCAVMIAKQENIDLSFRQMIEEAKGKTFGARLINWAMSKMDADIADDLAVSWGGIRQKMASTIEMLIRELEPNILPGTIINPVHVTAWIQKKGGIGQLHMESMRLRQTEINAEKANKERDRKFGQHERRLKQAKDAGFDTIEAYDSHIAEEAKKQRESQLREKFDEIKHRLVENGKVVIGNLPENHLIIVSDGTLYCISDTDESTLLSCMASVM